MKCNIKTASRVVAQVGKEYFESISKDETAPIGARATAMRRLKKGPYAVAKKSARPKR